MAVTIGANGVKTLYPSIHSTSRCKRQARGVTIARALDNIANHHIGQTGDFWRFWLMSSTYSSYGAPSPNAELAGSLFCTDAGDSTGSGTEAVVQTGTLNAVSKLVSFVVASCVRRHLLKRKSASGAKTPPPASWAMVKSPSTEQNR